MSSAEALIPEEFMRLSREQALAKAKEQLWYHTMNVTDDFQSEGFFDLREVISGYGFPDDLSGKRVLDVGRSSGFFAFEFEKRNAEVVATELPKVTDKDFIGGDITKSLIAEWFNWQGRKGWENVSASGTRADFYLAHKLRNSKVIPVECRIEDVGQLGTFDLVFLGSILNHIRDVAGALQAAYAATSDLCIIANPVLLDGGNTPRIEFKGTDIPGLTTWFVPNVAALVRLVEAAGFTEVVVHDPALALPFKNKTMPHAIIHARRGSSYEARLKFASKLSAAYPGIEEMIAEKA